METIQLNDLIWFLIVGGFAGWVASVLVEGSGLVVLGDIAVGVIGAFLGGFLARQFGITAYGFWEVLGVSIMGAVVLLVILRAFTPTRKAVS